MVGYSAASAFMREVESRWKPQTFKLAERFHDPPSQPREPNPFALQQDTPQPLTEHESCFLPLLEDQPPLSRPQHPGQHRPQHRPIASSFDAWPQTQLFHNQLSPGHMGDRFMEGMVSANDSTTLDGWGSSDYYAVHDDSEAFGSYTAWGNGTNGE